MPQVTLAYVLQHLRTLAESQAARDMSDGELLERYRTRREETAFALLVQRHGPMVLSVCRRVLGDAHAAEDAFQATFLVLVRRAGSIRKPASVASWLHGVAERIARRARARAAARRGRERQVGEMRRAEPLDEMTWQELRPVLDEEIGRLPEKYRAPVVLCYLEGKAYGQAARDLGWPKSSLASRLNRARDLLRQRLAQRGITLSAGLLTTVLAEKTAEASIPALLTLNTVRAAALLAAGKAAAAGKLSAQAVILAEEAMKGMLGIKGTLVGALLALGLAVGSTGFAVHHAFRASGESQAQAEPGELRAPAAGARGNRALETAKAARTDANGDPLPEDAVSRLGTLRFRHGDRIRAIRFTAGGKELVTQGWDGVRVWEAATGREKRHIAGDRFRRVSSASASPDERWVATADDWDGPITLWEGSSGRQVRAFGSRHYTDVLFSPDGKVLAALRGEIELWDPATGQLLRSWKGHEFQAWSALFLPGCKTLVTGGADQAIRFWDPATGRQIRQITAAPNYAGSLVASPDGRLLAAINATGFRRHADGRILNPGFADNRIRLWDVVTGKEVRVLVVPVKGLAWFETLAFAPDSKMLATSGVDAFVRLWDATTGRELRRFALGPRGRPSALAFSPDGKVLAAAADDRVICRIDVITGKVSCPGRGHQSRVSQAALTPDGRTLATTGTGERAILLWDPATGRERGRLEPPGDFAGPILLGADGRTLLSSGERMLWVWDLATGKELRRLTGEHLGKWLPLLALSPDGRLLVLASDGTAVLVDPATGKEVRRLNRLVAGGNGAAFSADGQTLVLWSGDGKAHVWDPATGQERRQIPFHDSLPAPGLPIGFGGGFDYTAALSPDGKRLVFGSRNGFLVVHDLATGKEVRRITGLPIGLSALAFAPDGRMLALGGFRDPAVRLVELATGQERCHFEGHRGGITSLTFAADSHMLVSTSNDTTALVWDVTGRLRAEVGRGKELGPGDLDRLWAELAGADAARGFRAMQALAAAPAQALPYLRAHLRPVAAVPENRLAGLVAELDSDRFPVRQKAAAELERLGEAAVPAYRAILAGSPSAEVRRQVEGLLEKQRAGLLAPERLREVRAVEVLEWLGGPDARQLLEVLADGFAGARLTAEAKASLERLGRHPVGTR